ncbi:Zinc carboxypeptidase A 1 [Folsomia candida]|uniref:Zinc carboxypeptidase A 1 n=1 Tax=Folsomia candida TaxID=158441 RepID=A0A226EC62_FOLCA|nr:Zinc carboxypeptidase A 1 [Folsomia candida]
MLPIVGLTVGFISTLIGLTTSAMYDGHSMLRVTPQTKRQEDHLRDLGKHQGVSFIGGDPLVGDHSHVIASPQVLDFVLESLKKFETEHLLTNPDVGRSGLERMEGYISWDAYYDLDSINQYLTVQSVGHPDLVTLTTIGKSFEGRDLFLLKINNGSTTKPIIWIDSNIHAREWISSAVGLYLIDQLLNSPDIEIQAYLDDFNFHILPMANPDGFVFSHLTDRFWRKTRSNTSATAINGCRGVDRNRNFDAYWLENDGGSKDPCDLYFAGDAVFTELECIAIAQYLDSIRANLIAYISLHSWGQNVLIPTGRDSTQIPEYNEYIRIANLAAAAHQIPHSMIYTTGNPAPGTSMDWAYLNFPSAKIHLTYEFRDKGQYTVLLPADQILPQCEEFMAGIKVIFDELK